MKPNLHFYLYCTFIVFIITLNSAASETVIHHCYDSNGVFSELSQSSQNTIAGSYAKLSETIIHPEIKFKDGISGELAISMWICPYEFRYEGNDGFSDVSPVTVFSLGSSDNDNRIILRIHKKKLQLLFRCNTPRRMLFSDYELGLKKWVHLAVVLQKNEVRLYIDGMLDTANIIQSQNCKWDKLKIGQSAGRRFFIGGIDEVRVYDDPVTLQDIRDSIKKDSGSRKWEGRITPVKRGHECTYGKYPALKVKKNAFHPIAVGFGPAVTKVPWTGKDSDDLIIGGVGGGFGTRLAIYREKGNEPDSPRQMKNKPYYGPGETLDIKGGHFRAINRNNGKFDLIAEGTATVYSKNNLVYYRNTGTVGKPEFAFPEPVEVAGTTFRDAFKNTIKGWFIADVDQDGVNDLLVTTASGNKFKYFPDGKSIWNNQPHANSGYMKGYDIRGQWLGSHTIHEMFWAKGVPSSSNHPKFSKPEKVYYRVPGFGVQLKSYCWLSSPGYIQINNKPYILFFGDVDKIWAMPIKVNKNDIFCEKAVNLLKDGSVIKDVYVQAFMETADLDEDGDSELLLAGNPGRVTVLKGDKVGEFVEAGSLRCRGGKVETDTLVSPARADWDKDGNPDLICGDSSGLLSFWPGTDDPMVYGSPQWFKSNGERIQHQAGPTGSLQGPAESRWGYIHPTVGDWDEDGDLDIITGDINAEVTLYEQQAKPFELVRDLFTMDSKPLPAAWRIRPAIISSKFSFKDSNKPCLLYTNHEGNLAVGIPDNTGSTRINESVQLEYEDGNKIKVCGIRGQWGRTKIAVADWDEDGRWDILWGTSGGVQKWSLFKNEKYYGPEFRTTGAMPFFLRNVGTNSAPVFEREKIIRFKSGEMIDLSVHNASVWPTDMNYDRKLDLIIGAEDGRVYYFDRKSLSWSE